MFYKCMYWQHVYREILSLVQMMPKQTTSRHKNTKNDPKIEQSIRDYSKRLKFNGSNFEHSIYAVGKQTIHLWVK